MAKLNEEKATEAKNASTGFTPMPDGTYRFILKDVDPTREGPKGPYWSWEFECIEPEPVEVLDEESGETKEMKILGRKQWNNTSMSAMWSFNQTFEAFGVPTDTDTDEILGKPCLLVLSVRTIQSGARKGELTNQVERIKPADPEDPVIAAYLKQKAGEKEMADLF
jgi:hypothetical protein